MSAHMLQRRRAYNIPLGSRLYIRKKKKKKKKKQKGVICERLVVVADVVYPKHL